MANLTSTTFDDTGFLNLPAGTTAERPASPAIGYIRFNTSTDLVEVYTATGWINYFEVPLHGFVGLEFSNGGRQSTTGPSLLELLENGGPYSGQLLPDPTYFSIVNGIQKLTIPDSGYYRIQAWGAAGGPGGSRATGGSGAIIRGDVLLEKGEVINIIVGQNTPGTNEGSGGGGGSFVWRDSNDQPLIIAGGGGGSGEGSNPRGVDANTGTSGTTTATGGTAGTNGNGGSTNTTDQSGGAGGGFLTDGADGSSNASEGGFAALNGGNGGTGDENSTTTNAGGFGGGGGESFNTTDTEAGGGGGGYSGGASSGNNDTGGGGGGSFIVAGALNVATSNGSFATTGGEPHPTYSGAVGNLGSFNTGTGRVQILKLF
jgi:hypothetical protein